MVKLTAVIPKQTIPIRFKAKFNSFTIIISMTKHVLIIGRHHLFHDGLTHLLSDHEDLEVVASVRSWDKARETMSREQPDVLIVDHESSELLEHDLTPLLDNIDQDIKVIYLTLAQNKMIIHKRQQIANVTAEDLLEAVQSSTEEGSS